MNWLALFALPCKFKSDDGDMLEDPIVFVERFWKWRDSLVLVARRVLGDEEAAMEAVEACFLKACRKPPKSKSEGAFGSWLVRILLDEALQARAARRNAGSAMRRQTFRNAQGTMAAKLEFMDIGEAV